jgi:hypothetical protein
MHIADVPLEIPLVANPYAPGNDAAIAQSLRSGGETGVPNLTTASVGV